METTIIDYNWQADAICNGMAPEDGTQEEHIMYPTMGRIVPQEVYDMCARCPVNEQCLAHALKYEEYGFFAGTKPMDRVKMRKELGIQLQTINAYFIKHQVMDVIQETVFSRKIQGRGRKPREVVPA